MTLKFPGIGAVSKLVGTNTQVRKYVRAHRKQSVIYLCCLEFGKRYILPVTEFMPLRFSKTAKKRCF